MSSLRTMSLLQVLLVLVIVSFAFTIADIVREMSRYQTSVKEVADYGAGWPVTQAIGELAKFQEAANRFLLFRRAQDKEDFLLRFEIVKNRYNVLNDGAVAEFTATDSIAQKAMQDFKEALTASERLMKHAENPKNLNAVINRLAPLTNQVSKMAGEAYQKNSDMIAARLRDIVDLQWRFTEACSALVVVCTLLISLLVLQNRMISRANRKSLEAIEEIEKSEARYHSLTDSLPQLMWTAHADGELNYVNARCLEITGAASLERFIQDWKGCVHPDEVPLVREAWRTSMRLRTPFLLEYRIRQADGDYRWFLGKAVPVYEGPARLHYWIGTATDIEDQKRAATELRHAKEAAEQANATKSAFLANMSHEIRTPLGAILGFSNLLRHPLLREEDRVQYLAIINRNGQSLTRIIDDILDLAKVEAGLLDIEKIAFSFPSLLNEVVEVFQYKAESKRISLELVLDPNVPAEMFSDPTRLRQILINIVGNALKFTEEGGIKIRVHAEPRANAAFQIVIEVTDTGLGLTEDQKLKLFRPFTQADNTTTRRFGGTGLGLALSKRLSEALGGDIQLAPSADGQPGSTFIVTFRATAVERPQVLSEALPANPSEDSVPPEAVLSRALKVLVVDDCLDNQFLAEQILVRIGAKVELASNGREAVERAIAGRHDVILMDIQMPEMDGFEAIRILLESGYRRPIVAWTAHAMTEDRTKILAAKFADHLTKPIVGSELIRVVRKMAEASYV